MFDNQTFQQLVEADNLTGEVTAVNSFIIEVKGLESVRLGAQVLFEDGQRGLVREAYGDRVIVAPFSIRISPSTWSVGSRMTPSMWMLEWMVPPTSMLVPIPKCIEPRMF